jgi:carbon storage regulator
MLVLSRKRGESIMIGGDVEVTILDVGADHVKVGVSAPKRVEILRKELYTAIIESNLQSAEPVMFPEEAARELRKIAEKNFEKK